MPLTSPSLWVVATPLGNTGDLSPRARHTLEEADIVLAEDTRRAGLLCQRCGVTVQRFLSCHDHNEQTRIPEILRLLQKGQCAALITDAGTPLIADPGYRLVRACRKAGLPVSVVPGPCAPVAALAASGIAPQPFSFLGFLPRDAAGQRTVLSAFATVPTTLVFFERKDRLPQTLDLAKDVLGHRELCIVRELTKSHEEFILGRLETHDALSRDLLGEITVIVGPPEEYSRTPRDEVYQLLITARTTGGRPRELVRRVQDQVQGWSNKELYAALQALDTAAG